MEKVFSPVVRPLKQFDLAVQKKVGAFVYSLRVARQRLSKRQVA